MKKKLAASIVGGIVVFGFGLFLTLYQPLLRELRIQATGCHSLEATAADARGRASLFRAVGTKKALISEEGVMIAMNGLTRQGRMKGVRFISVTPKGTVKKEGGGFRIMPIEMELESRYEKLGAFLGSLEELEESLVTVGEFTATPDPKDSGRIRTKLILNMHLVE